MYDNRYLYPVTVGSVGVGGITADGKLLRTIGNLTVRPGDVVYTDGRIVYGHVPIKPDVEVAGREKCVPYAGESRYCGALTLSGTQIRKANYYSDFRQKTSNWLYTTRDAVYAYTMQSDNPSAQKFDADDSSFYLDIKVAGNAVYTAEYTNSDLPFEGLTAKHISTSRKDPTFYAVNFYINEAAGYSPDNPAFTFNWFTPDYPEAGDGGRLYNNTGIRIRRNGVEVQVIDLSQYQFALDKLKEIYVSYDSLNSEAAKRYHYAAYVPAEAEKYYSQIDIFVTYMLSQCVHFHFTDNAGNWEMILLSMVEGSPNPHTSDTEEMDDKTVDVDSVFSFGTPVIYCVMRIRSNGEPEILQHRVVVTKYVNNYVLHSRWVNAKNYPIETMDDNDVKKFFVNFGDCSFETDLRHIFNVYYKGTVIRSTQYWLRSFVYLVITNYHASVKPGAVNSFLSLDLSQNDSEYVMGASNTHVGFVSGNQIFQYGVRQDTSIGRASFITDGTSYFGRLSVVEKGGKHIFTIFGQQIFVTDRNGNETLQTAPYCYNHNADILKDVRKLKKPKTIRDLVADVTRS